MARDKRQSSSQHCSAWEQLYSSPPFFLAFLLVSSLCGDTMEAERGRYDGWNKPGGGPGKIRMEGPCVVLPV